MRRGRRALQEVPHLVGDLGLGGDDVGLAGFEDRLDAGDTFARRVREDEVPRGKATSPSERVLRVLADLAD